MNEVAARFGGGGHRLAAGCTVPGGDLEAARGKVLDLLRQFAEQGEPLCAGRSHGRMDSMKTTIDSAGRIVIPKSLREEAGLEPGREVEVRLRGGIVEIEPAPLEVRLEKAGPFVVASPRSPVPPLTVEEVESTRFRLRKERASEP